MTRGLLIGGPLDEVVSSFGVEDGGWIFVLALSFFLQVGR